MTVQGLISTPEQEKLLEQVMAQIIEDAVPQGGLANELIQYSEHSEQGMQFQ